MSSIPHKSGVYMITCTANGKIYIGSSVNVYDRWVSHRWHLVNDKHHNHHLQRAWNKYGELSFSINLIEEVESNRLIEREQYWLDTLNPYGKRGFNIAVTANCPNKGQPLTLEHRAKISCGNKGKTRSEKVRAAQIARLHTPEAHAKMAETKRGQKQSPELIEKRIAPLRGRHGKVVTEETRAKMKSAATGRKRSHESRLKQSATLRLRQPLMGYKHTSDARSNMSAAQKRRIRTPEELEKFARCQRRGTLSDECRERIGYANAKTFVVTTPDGAEIVIRNLTQFCRQNGLSVKKMSMVSTGRYKQHKGWKCRRVD